MSDSVFNDIYARAPINRTAAVVTSQKGCGPQDELAEERENLVAKWKQIELRLLQIKDKKDPLREKLIKDKRVVEERISAIKCQLKLRPRSVDLSQFMIDVMKERLSKLEYLRIVAEAERRYNAQHLVASEVANDTDTH